MQSNKGALFSQTVGEVVLDYIDEKGTRIKINNESFKDKTQPEISATLARMDRKAWLIGYRLYELDAEI